MFAIVSDIHANIEALTNVLRDIESKGITDIVCLGDVVGYGPNPRECIEKAMEWRFTIRGNHEDALLFLATDFNLEAAQAIEWTRNQINSKQFEKTRNHELWNFLGALGERVDENGIVFVHGSPRQPTREYVRPADAHDKEKMGEIFDMIDHLCFVGHTHEPGVFTQEGKFLFPKAIGYKHNVSKGKFLINVGSVGQSRDRDPRSCYVTCDGETVQFHRVEYDFQITMKKIGQIKELPTHLALRLKDGR